MPALCVSEFRSLFHVRRECVRALLELSRRQMALIADDDYTQLLTVLGQKQRVLGRLDELNGRHPGLREQWRDRRDSFAAGDRAECEQLLADTESLLARLLDEEKTSTEHLTERRDATQKQLQAITRGGQVHDAYRDNLAPVTHRHLDTGR